MLIYVLEVGTIRAAACCSVSRISWDTRLPGPAEINSDNSLSLSFLGENKLLVTVSLPQVLTKDSVTVSVDAVVYYRVSNATVSVANVENAHHSTR